MRNAVAASGRCSPTLIGICLLGAFLAGCPFADSGSDDTNGGGETPLVASSGNAPAMTAASKTAYQMMQAGNDVATIQAALVSQLQGESQVASAEADTSADVVWAIFQDGETHCIWLVDQTTDDADPDSGSATAKPRAESPRTSRNASPTGGADVKTVRQAQAGTMDYFRMPANNKAFLGNALCPFHANWLTCDGTDLIEKMLKARGYDVVRSATRYNADGTVAQAGLAPADFQNLTDYGLIFIEAHGAVRGPESPVEILGGPTCGGGFSGFTILTSERTTEQSIVANAQDILCGRLTLWDVKLRQPGGKVTEVQYFGVTPNYIREHCKGKQFPKNTLLILNACRGYRSGTSSPFATMVHEMCAGGGNFVGWTDRVHYYVAQESLLNLFQLMTAANEERTIKGNLKLEKSTPPQGGTHTSFNRAWYQCTLQSMLVDPKTGAQLLWAPQDQTPHELLIVPHVWWWATDFDGKTFRLNMFADEQPQVTIGGTAVAVSNIGSSTWSVNAPSALYGDIIVTEAGRTSVARPLRRFRPQVSFSGSSGGMTYSATLTLYARATLDSTAFRTNVTDNAPTAHFGTTYFEPAACTLGWTVSGQETSGDYVYQYSGNGLRALTDAETGTLECNSSGTTVRLSAQGTIRYTVAWTNTKTGAQGSYETDASLSVDRSGLSLSSNWTIASASYTTSAGVPGTAQVSWNAFTAEPPFDNNEPR